MDDRIKEIIESGLMEAYLLGLCSTEQETEIDALLSSSEELRNYFSELEDVQFQMTEEVKMAPPESLRDKIKVAVRDSQKPDEIPSQGNLNKSPFNWTLVISLLVIAACLLMMLNLYVSNIELSRELDRTNMLLQKQEQFRFDLDEQLNLLQEQMLIVKDRDTKRVVLNGNNKASDLRLVAYWNNNTKSSLLSVEKLPSLPDGQCFQMWADVEGEMLNLGVIKDEVQMVALNYLDNAESLNITIEPEGGSDHPNVSNLVASQAI